MIEQEPLECIYSRAVCTGDGEHLAAWARSLPQDEARCGVEMMEAFADRVAYYRREPIPALIVDEVVHRARLDATEHRPTRWSASNGLRVGELIIPKWEVAARSVGADPDDERLLELYSAHLEAAARLLSVPDSNVTDPAPRVCQPDDTTMIEFWHEDFGCIVQVEADPSPLEPL